MTSFLKQKLFQPILGLLKQGANPSKLALAVSLGIVIGFVPVFGMCTILCLAAIWIFKVNPAATLIANQIAYPLQFVLYFPFIRVGAWVFNQPPVPFSLQEIVGLFASDLFEALALLGWSTLYALIVWFAISLPLAYVLRLALTTAFEKTAFRNARSAKEEVISK